MLKSSTKSVARDVVSTLIDPKKDEGVLLQLTKMVEDLPVYQGEDEEEKKDELFIDDKPQSAKVKRRNSREIS